MHIYLTERQKELVTGLLVILTVVGGLGVGEVAIRLVHVWKFGFAGPVEDSDTFYDDPATGLVLPRPGTVHGDVTINDLGFRSPPLAMPKPEGVVRIAFLGSSTTYDGYADGATNWPAVTVEGLQSATTCRIDYLNAGSPGLNTGDMNLHYDRNVAATEPDIVVILPSDLNSDADDYVVEQGLHDGVHYRSSWMAQVSKIWEEFELNGMVIKRQRMAHSRADKIQVDPKAISARFKKRLETFVDRVVETGAMPVLLGLNNQLRHDQTPEEQIKAAVSIFLYMPYLSIPQVLEIKDAYNRAIEDIAKDRRLPYVSAPELNIPGTPEYYADTNHYNAYGSALAGQNLATLLQDSPALTEILNRCPAQTQ